MAPDVTIDDPEMHLLLTTQLREGETLKWATQPRPWRIAAKGMLLGLIGLSWTVYALIMASVEFYSAAHSDRPHPLITWNLLRWTWTYLTLLGLGITSAPLWYWRKGKRTVYGLSDQRAMVVERRGRGRLSVRSMRCDGVASLHCKEKKDGSGDLIFKPKVSRLMHQGQKKFANLEFLGIERVRQVEEMVRQCGGNSLAEPEKEPLHA